MSAPAQPRQSGRLPALRVVTGQTAAAIILADLPGCMAAVRDAYLAHAAGRSTLPHSSFLRFKDRPEARIIALPAHLETPRPLSGIKWIASFPANVDAQLPRASAVLVLNEHATGFPFAVMEAAAISAARTAASAALAAEMLAPQPRRAAALGIIGAGLIAKAVCRFLFGTGWQADEVLVHDLCPDRALAFAESLAQQGIAARAVAGSAQAIQNADLVLLATVASSPHLLDPGLFAHGPLVLHLSLRDLGAEVAACADNVVDDVEHVLRAGTSLELAEQLLGHREFICATLAELLAGKHLAETGRPVVFSPFGLGVLDIAVGRWVFEEAVRSGRAQLIDGFFHECAW